MDVDSQEEADAKRFLQVGDQPLASGVFDLAVLAGRNSKIVTAALQQRAQAPPPWHGACPFSPSFRLQQPTGEDVRSR